ncbi:efflux RND transporter periplasmic adaptor subunit [Chromatiaceae bacterium AAb-1]|nr:efflux RND transporter periplasmic adaptor subunit [Chromatiaceae bacterium AAb-1]
MKLINMLLGSLLLTAISTEARQQSQQGSGVPVHTAIVKEQNVPVWIRGIGQVKPLQSVEIKPQTNGILEQILVSEGQLVKKGEVVARLDDRAINAALEQSGAQAAMVKVQLEIARRDLNRYQNLRQEQVVSQQLFEQQEAITRQLEAELKSLEANIRAQQVQLSYTRLLSPVEGQVGIRNVDTGNYVSVASNQSLFSIVQLDPISVEAFLPQNRLPELHRLMQNVRQQHRVPVQAFMQDGGVLLAEGELVVVDNQVTTGSGSVRIKADFVNSNHMLWPGQSVVIALQSQLLDNALTIPAKAVQQGPSGTFVWLERDGIAETAEINVVLKERDYTVVTGLDAGQVVIIDGQSRLTPGAALRIINSQGTAE